MMLARCGGMLTAMSTSPFWSDATRTASSGIGRNMTVLILGAPLQYCSFASRTISSSFTQRASLYGPVPIGVLEMNALSLSAYAFGGELETGRKDTANKKSGPSVLGGGPPARAARASNGAGGTMRVGDR